MATKDKEEKAPTVQGLIILPKITVVDVGCNAQAVLARKQEGAAAKEPLMRVYGVVTGYKKKMYPAADGNPAREFFPLVGNFRAINIQKGQPQTGMRFRSGILYLPEGVHDMYLEPAKLAQNENESIEIIFGVDVYSRLTSSPVGYGYACDVLGNVTEENEDILRLEQEMTNKNQLLLS